MGFIAFIAVLGYARDSANMADMMNLCTPEEISPPVAMEFAPPASDDLRAMYQSPFFFHTEWAFWVMTTFVFAFSTLASCLTLDLLPWIFAHVFITPRFRQVCQSRLASRSSSHGR